MRTVISSPGTPNKADLPKGGAAAGYNGRSTAASRKVGGSDKPGGKGRGNIVVNSPHGSAGTADATATSPLATPRGSRKVRRGATSAADRDGRALNSSVTSPKRQRGRFQKRGHATSAISPTTATQPAAFAQFQEFRVANGRFIVKRRIGGGSFGEIYAGVDTWRDGEVAFKFERLKSRPPQLSVEYRVYRYLYQNSMDVVGIPEVHWFGTEGDFNIMVMDICGPSLEDLFSYCERRFSLKTVCMLADQMLHRIEFVHSRHFIHRDVKAENFVMGIKQRGHHVYLIDFGLAKRYWDPRSMQHISYKEGKALTGTARYCSVNVHLGLEQSRRDDLESIGYLLVYFAKGSLPWQGVRAQDTQHKVVRIGEKKINASLEALCRDLPQAFYQYMRYTRMLRFEEAPDYAWCRHLFRAHMEKDELPRDWVFDWVVRRQRELELTNPNQVPQQRDVPKHSESSKLDDDMRPFQGRDVSISSTNGGIAPSANLSLRDAMCTIDEEDAFSWKESGPASRQQSQR